MLQSCSYKTSRIKTSSNLQNVNSCTQRPLNACTNGHYVKSWECKVERNLDRAPNCFFAKNYCSKFQNHTVKHLDLTTCFILKDFKRILSILYGIMQILFKLLCWDRIRNNLNRYWPPEGTNARHYTVSIIVSICTQSLFLCSTLRESTIKKHVILSQQPEKIPSWQRELRGGGH